MRKKIIYGLLLLMLVPLLVYLLAVYLNNRNLDYPSKTVLQQSLHHSMQWLQANQGELMSQANPMLWWMLYEAHALRPDPQLTALLERYQQSHPQVMQSAWRPLFSGEPRPHITAYDVQGLPYYNQHFIYALNCAGDIAREIPVVEQQNHADFCFQRSYIYRPACITHQLMGISFLKASHCNLLPDIDEVIQSLQHSVVSQLFWDIRVVDVYLQRVLMLLITGAEDQVKPVWIQQILDHQLQDGGWDGYEPLLNLHNRSIGFNGKGIGMGPAKADMKASFHTTAQGVYILTYLLHVKQAGIPD